MGALLKIIRMVGPTHVTVVFDGECQNPRAELDCKYKANREDYSQMPEEETPFSQLPDIYAALDHQGTLPFTWEQLAWQDRGPTSTQVLKNIGVY